MRWTKFGSAFEREYLAIGVRGEYKIDLDQPPIDRWAIFLNGRRLVEDVYFEKNAERIAEHFDQIGNHTFPSNLRTRPDGGKPRFLVDAIETVSGADTDPSQVLVVEKLVTAASRIHQEPDVVAQCLVTKVKNLGIEVDKTSVTWSPWQSGVYCLLDAVYSARTRYELVVVPMLKRLHSRANMSDCPERTFSDFINDVDAYGEDKFEMYASQVLNRQWLGGRLKVAVAYDAARFFDQREVQTMADLQAMGGALGELILAHLKNRVVGIGPALSNYLLALLGNEDRIKLDVMLLRFWERLDCPVPNPQSQSDYDFALDVYRMAARLLETSPARLDKAIWNYESVRAGLS